MLILLCESVDVFLDEDSWLKVVSVMDMLWVVINGIIFIR